VNIGMVSFSSQSAPGQPRTFSETPRQLLHMAMGAFALLLRVLTWWQAALCAVTALIFNAVVLPRLGGRRFHRPADDARGFPLGILLYPLAVLLLILVFPRRLDIAAAAWGILAAGDGMATLVGRGSRGGKLPWNADKSWGGTSAFVVAGGAAGVFLAWWTRPAIVPAPSLAFVVCAPLAGAIVAALVETLHVRLDDNLSVPAAAALVIWSGSLMTAAAWHVSAPAVLGNLPVAVALNLVAATLGWRAGTVTWSGAAAGATIGLCVYASTGPAGWLLLFGSFLAASVSSRMGLERKALLGIAEDRGGRRGAGNAMANCLVAVFAGVLAVTTPHATYAMLAFVTALAAGGSDTVASEIGKAWGRRTFLVPTFRLVKPGTSGAVSLEGTAAGVVCAFALAALGVAGGLLQPNHLWFAVVGATVGAFAESWLGATLEAPGILNNDLLNFLNTAVAASVAVLLALALGR
jgi:uncharacterized protein (TIGR00297 family)